MGRILRLGRTHPTALGQRARRVSGTFGYHRVERPQVAEKTNCPNANVLVGMVQLCAEKRFVGSADHIQRTQDTKLLHRIGLLFEERTQLGARRFEIGAAEARSANCWRAPRTYHSFGVQVQLDQIADSATSTNRRRLVVSVGHK